MKKLVFVSTLMMFLVGTVSAQDKRDWSPDKKAEHKATMISDEMDLSAEEQERLTEVYSNYFNRKSDMKADGVKDKEQYHTLKAEKNDEIKSILGEERYEQYLELKGKKKKHRHKKKHHKQKHHKRGDGGGSMQMKPVD